MTVRLAFSDHARVRPSRRPRPLPLAPPLAPPPDARFLPAARFPRPNPPRPSPASRRVPQLFSPHSSHSRPFRAVSFADLGKRCLPHIDTPGTVAFDKLRKEA